MNIDLIAHRGFAGVYPENTIKAVSAASGHRSSDLPESNIPDLIEIDVMPTMENDIVVHHDESLSDHTNTNHHPGINCEYIWELPTKKVIECEIGQSGETIPLLTELLAAIPNHIGVNIEMKNPGSSNVFF